MPIIKVIHYSRLDTLRFFAFFLVFWMHAFSVSFSNISSDDFIQSIIDKIMYTGPIGVHLFFVLSGFLITHLMVSEEKVSGKFNLWHFYLRRVLRIWPLYYLVMILGIFVLPSFVNTFTFDGSIIKNLLFWNNFDSTHHAINVGVAWSVAIEEQFYLVWPLVFLLLKNKKALILGCFTLFILSVLFIINNPIESNYHTFGNVTYLMSGCIGALLFSEYKVQFENSVVAKSKALPILIIVTVFFVLIPIINNDLLILSVVFLPICYMNIIFNLVINNSEKVSFFSKLGKYTYGMYLYHITVIILVRIVFDKLNADYFNDPLVNILVSLISLAITIVISIFSYNYFEKYFLKIKSKFSPVKTRL
ncbi:MAG: acyltransferase [Flavobacteriales bacterium]|nr:acyltransferase [Flavobacteriales bacterium]